MTWGAAEEITKDAFSKRAPLAAAVSAGTLLVFRSNQSLSYTSTVYHATQTIDARYAGSTTVNTRNSAKLALRGTLEDFLAYTFDAGQDGVRTNDDRIAPDTIGLFVTPDTADPDKIKAAISRVSRAIDEFMPITSRVVFITP